VVFLLQFKQAPNNLAAGVSGAAANDAGRKDFFGSRKA
jgi:hypothetical protein